MGVYLPNMEMPLKGQMLVIFPDGTSYVCFNGMRERLTQTTAVPVPPHGRLGDLDALKAKAIERSEKCGEMVNVLDKVITAHDISTAPTIIPAEPDEAPEEEESDV